MSTGNAKRKPRYFSTRDLLIIAVFASLGGVASTYVNALGDAIHAALGLPGATQWAAGLHVIWLVLGMGILHKPGTGVLIGTLKGAVELISGNSHGVIILLIDLVAGLLIDFAFLLFRDKQSLLPFLVSGSLASASNVFVFQLFASIPLNTLGISALFILVFVAFISGLIFSGIVPFYLINALVKAGVVKRHSQPNQNRKIGWWIVVSVLLITSLLTGFFLVTYKGPPKVQITGNVIKPFEFQAKDQSMDKVTRKMTYKGMLTEYSGFPLIKIIEDAMPESNANTILVEASDGYAFLLSFTELATNENILLVENEAGQKTSYDIVGPESSKAWVRNVTKMTIITSQGLTIFDIDDHLHHFDPDNWVSEMDSALIALPGGSQKLQGVPVFKIIQQISSEFQPIKIKFSSPKDFLEISWTDLKNNSDIRVFTVIEAETISFTLAEMSGDVLLLPLDKIEID